jgi:hypothetical protein
MFPQMLLVAQSIAVIVIYTIIWNNITSVLAKLPRSAHYVVLVLLVAFMYTTSNYSFQFAKVWGI